MSIFENPSAGQFGPPPENAQRELRAERLRTVAATEGDSPRGSALAYLGLEDCDADARLDRRGRSARAAALVVRSNSSAIESATNGAVRSRTPRTRITR